MKSWLLVDERQKPIDDVFGFLAEFIYKLYATSATHLLCSMWYVALKLVISV